MSPLRSDGSHYGQEGRLDQVTSGQRHSRESWSAALGSQGTYLNRQNDSPKEHFLLLRGCWRDKMLQNEDDEDEARAKIATDSTYSFSGDVEEVRCCRWDDEAEVRTKRAHITCGSNWVLKNLSFGPSIHNPIWPPKLLPQSSRRWKEVSSTHLTPLCVWGGGRKWADIEGIQILNQTFTHDKIKTGHPIFLGLVMTKNSRISSQQDRYCIEPRRLMYSGSQLDPAMCVVMWNDSHVELKFVFKSCFNWGPGSRQTHRRHA